MFDKFIQKIETLQNYRLRREPLHRDGILYNDYANKTK